MNFCFINYINNSDKNYGRFSLNFDYFNDTTINRHRELRNKYRSKIGMEEIEDQGSFVYFTLRFGRRVIGFHLDIRNQTYKR